MGADRQHRPKLPSLWIVLATSMLAPGDIDLEAAPSKWPPQQRFDHSHRLHAPSGDGFGGGVEKAGAHTQPVVRLGNRQVVGAVEAPPEDSDGADCDGEAGAEDPDRGPR